MSRPHSGRQSSLICLLFTTWRADDARPPSSSSLKLSPKLERTWISASSSSLWFFGRQVRSTRALIHCYQRKFHFWRQFKHKKKRTFPFSAPRCYFRAFGFSLIAMNGYYRHMIGPPIMSAAAWLLLRQLWNRLTFVQSYLSSNEFSLEKVLAVLVGLWSCKYKCLSHSFQLLHSWLQIQMKPNLLKE